MAHWERETSLAFLAGAGRKSGRGLSPAQGTRNLLHAPLSRAKHEIIGALQASTPPTNH